MIAPSELLPNDTALADVLSVAALNRLARATLERNLPLLRIAGEISNLTRASSGHLYFTLKDDQAQVRCTMWRNKAQLLAFRPENGARVEARALVTLYEARGDYQLSIEGLKPAGTGSLFEAFVRLREKLAAEGLFETALKRPVPRFPRRIGVITSTAAAALQDVIAALRRRAPHLEVVLYPAPVQGEGAARALTSAVDTASRRAAGDRVDVLLLVRGGGSLEDLWAFNDEELARSIRNCPIPVICGVGHETDITIADFAADLRAATPTGAAELASSGYHEAASRLADLGAALMDAQRRQLNAFEQCVDRIALRLRHPRERLARSGEQTTRLAQRLRMAVARRLERARNDTGRLALQLKSGRPSLEREQARWVRSAERLTHHGERIVRTRAEHLDALAVHLEHLAPRSVLARGYSITRNEKGEILRSTDLIDINDKIVVELAHGEIDATVDCTRE